MPGVDVILGGRRDVFRCLHFLEHLLNSDETRVLKPTSPVDLASTPSATCALPLLLPAEAAKAPRTAPMKTRPIVASGSVVDDACSFYGDESKGHEGRAKRWE